ncbi:hypothetical protein QM565_02625 [Geitlerinema splendidum]|nr:hypothetical protein [Geitlerinema splendidum]
MLGQPTGARLLISTPIEVKAQLDAIPKGTERLPTDLRQELATKHQADATCPLTYGIFLRILAEDALDEMQQGKSVDEVTPFWRVIDRKAPLAKKLPCGIDFITHLRTEEGLGELMA